MLTVVDVADGLAHLPVTATHAVCHLHLRKVQVLRASSHLFQSHRILDECRIGDVGRRKPETHFRSFGLLLIGCFRFYLTLPIDQFLVLNLIMSTKRSHDCLNKMCQLCLTNTRRPYQMPHLTAKFVVFIVRIHELHISQMSGQSRNSHRNKRFAHVF